MNKRTINRRPLKVFCDGCWLCFYLSHKSLAGHRPANAVPDALDWWRGPVAVIPAPTWFLYPCWRLPGSLLLPLLPFTSLWPRGSCQNSDPSQTPLDPMTPGLLLGRSHPNFFLAPPTTSAGVLLPSQPWFLFSSPLLLCRAFLTPLQFTTYPLPVPKEPPGRSEDIGVKDEKFYMITYRM